MEKVQLDVSEGYFEFDVKMPEGKVVPCALDLYEAQNAIAALADKFPGDTQPVEQTAAIAEWLCTRGVPPLPHAKVVLLARKINDAVGEFKKKHGLDSDSPDSDDSTGNPSTTEQSPN